MRLRRWRVVAAVRVFPGSPRCRSLPAAAVFLFVSLHLRCTVAARFFSGAFVSGTCGVRLRFGFVSVSSRLRGAGVAPSVWRGACRCSARSVPVRRLGAPFRGRGAFTAGGDHREAGAGAEPQRVTACAGVSSFRGAVVSPPVDEGSPTVGLPWLRSRSTGGSVAFGTQNCRGRTPSPQVGASLLPQAHHSKDIFAVPHTSLLSKQQHRRCTPRKDTTLLPHTPPEGQSEVPEHTKGDTGTDTTCFPLPLPRRTTIPETFRRRPPPRRSAAEAS